MSGPSPNNAPAAPRRSWVTGALLQRCPRCREGRMFTSLFEMPRNCPVCGLCYRPEPGYFTGAMYFSYALALLIMVPLYFTLRWLLPDWSGTWVAVLAILLYLPLTPVVFRYSRVLFIYLDRSADPTDISFQRGWFLYQQEKEKGSPGSRQE
jgi:uncharacterized protein (DUF983 family)